jgi:hypothetical protein
MQQADLGVQGQFLVDLLTLTIASASVRKAFMSCHGLSMDNVINGVRSVLYMPGMVHEAQLMARPGSDVLNLQFGAITG